jgi:putative serine protease PepD
MATGRATADAPGSLTYPYLDGAEAQFPAFRTIAERAANGYAMVTLVAKPDPQSNDPGGDLHTGSGVILDADGHILTAAHIARGRQFAARVTLRDGRAMAAEILKVSPKHELALLKAARPLPESRLIPFGESARVKAGDPALALGSPRRRWGTVTIGKVRVPNIGERLDYGPWGFANAIELRMEVESGHSGGPLVNTRGELIGMVAGYELGDTTRPIYRSPRITYAVPVNDIRAWLGR